MICKRLGSRSDAFFSPPMDRSIPASTQNRISAVNPGQPRVTRRSSAVAVAGNSKPLRVETTQPPAPNNAPQSAPPVIASGRIGPVMYAHNPYAYVSPGFGFMYPTPTTGPRSAPAMMQMGGGGCMGFVPFGMGGQPTGMIPYYIPQRVESLIYARAPSEDVCRAPKKGTAADTQSSKEDVGAVRARELGRMDLDEQGSKASGSQQEEEGAARAAEEPTVPIGDADAEDKKAGSRRDEARGDGSRRVLALACDKIVSAAKAVGFLTNDFKAGLEKGGPSGVAERGAAFRDVGIKALEVYQRVQQLRQMCLLQQWNEAAGKQKEVRKRKRSSDHEKADDEGCLNTKTGGGNGHLMAGDAAAMPCTFGFAPGLGGTPFMGYLPLTAAHPHGVYPTVPGMVNPQDLVVSNPMAIPVLMSRAAAPVVTGSEGSSEKRNYGEAPVEESGKLKDGEKGRDNDKDKTKRNDTGRHGDESMVATILLELTSRD
ncbi:hypothetical protein BJ742DRAFT_146117 [Cladochytrium replicatum]|nr:hypothetical protein BJ742DRAFT_146117 [Cladochytrium replicatum]